MKPVLFIVFISLLMSCQDKDATRLITPPDISKYACRDKECVYYRVEHLYPIQQPTSNSCWATVLTMLLSWKENKHLDIEQVANRFGRKYSDLLAQSETKGIEINDEIELYKKADLEIMRQLNPSIDGWESYLKEFGPLSVTLDANPPYGGTIHAVLVTGIYGRIDAQNTDISYIDPLDGKEHLINFMDFLKMYEAKFSVDWKIQVICNKSKQ